MLKRLFAFFVYGTKDKRTYYEIKDEAMESNLKGMKVYSVIAAVVMTALTVSSFYVDSLVKNRFIYMACAVVCALLAFAVFLVRENKERITFITMYVLVVLMLWFGIMLGTYVDPDHVSVSFPILMFAVPLFFTDMPIHMTAIILFSMIAYYLTAIKTQSPIMVGYNMTNVIPYGLVSIFVSDYMTIIKLRRFELERQNQLAKEEQDAQMEEIMELNERLENINLSLEEQMKITKSLADIYTSAFLMPMDTNTFSIIKVSENFRSLVESIPSPTEAILQYCKYCVERKYFDSFAAFMDVDTLPARIADKTTISYEYCEHVENRDSIEWCRASWIVIQRDEANNLKEMLLTIEVITDSVIEREKLRGRLHAVEIDELTGVYTRQAFFEYAQNLLDVNKERQYDIIISDIVKFRQINNLYGEKVGDEILVGMAEFGRTNIFKNGINARYGPDQFVAIVPSGTLDYNAEMTATIKGASSASPIANIRIKNGVYRCVDRSLTVPQMCERALLAVNSIKNSFQDDIAYFDGEVSQRQVRAINYENWFEAAIADREFVVWYQPKCDAKTGELAGAEALIRWKHDGQMIFPGEYIEVFERTGQIMELDEYVFRRVCEYQSQRLADGKKLVPISVNLSRRSLYRPNLVEIYKAIVDEYNISSQYVPIEITESAVVSSTEIKPLVDAFAGAGFDLHMDDFGTGQSSFTGLSVLDFKVIKLDKSLIDAIGERRGEVVIQHMITLAKELGLHIVAEGVETEIQLQFLRENRCDVIQGYYFSRPLQPEDFEEGWLSKVK